MPGSKELIAEFVSPGAVGEDGYLGRAGLIPLPAAELEKARLTAAALQPNVPAPAPSPAQ